MSDDDGFYDKNSNNFEFISDVVDQLKTYGFMFSWNNYWKLPRFPILTLMWKSNCNLGD